MSLVTTKILLEIVSYVGDLVDHTSIELAKERLAPDITHGHLRSPQGKEREK